MRTRAPSTAGAQTGAETGAQTAAQTGAQAGFTLIEVIVVLAVLGMVGGMVLARGPARSAGLELRLAGNAVAQALRLARTEAIARNQPVPVVFDTAAATLRVGARAAQALPPGIAVAVVTAADESAGPRGAIRFLPDGSSTGGRVELASAGRRVQVGVDWVTGRVTAASGP